MTHITVRMAGASDISDIASIMKTAYEALVDKTVYVPDDEDFIRLHIAENGFTCLAECDGRVVGFLIVHLPGMSDENLGIDAGLPEKDLPYTAHMESCAVLETYRGHGIQRMLLMESEKELKRRGYRYAAATVSPHNPYSMENCEKMGYLTVAVKEKYGGLLRNIVIKKL